MTEKKAYFTSIFNEIIQFIILVFLMKNHEITKEKTQKLEKNTKTRKNSKKH